MNSCRKAENDANEEPDILAEDLKKFVEGRPIDLSL